MIISGETMCSAKSHSRSKRKDDGYSKALMDMIILLAIYSLQLNVIWIAYTVTVLEGTTVPVIMAGVVHAVTKV